VLEAAPSFTLEGTSIRLLRIEGPAARAAEAHELVVTTAGATGYLPPGATLHVPPDTTAYVATA
jgi:hypothetical protein